MANKTEPRPTVEINWLKVPHAYHCHVHDWWDAKRESGCPTCMAELRRELAQVECDLAAAQMVIAKHMAALGQK